MNTDKIAIITGTSKGMGLEMTKSLLDRGFLVFGGSRSECPIDHQNFIDLELDIRSESSVIKFYSEVAKETEVVDLLINNAGICEMNSFNEIDSAEFINHFNSNVLGAYLLLKYFEPFIISGETDILNILSVSAKYAYPSTASFTMSEFGKRGFLSVVEKEFKKYQVRFNNFYVGAVDTDLWDGYEGIEVDKMLSIEDFKYVFESVIDAPDTIQFPDITFLHRDGFLD